MSWKVSPPETIALLESALSELPCEKKRMFACPGYFANGSLFAGVPEGKIFLRLSLSDREAFLLDHPEILPFEPLAGRRMREYLVVPITVAEKGPLLIRWLTCAHRYASSLTMAVRPPCGRGRG